MKPRRPRLGAAVLGLAWVLFLVDRWLLPEGPLGTKIWLTLVGGMYVTLAMAAIMGRRAASAAIPWAGLLMGTWGVVSLLGLSADTTSSRTWMWASLFSLGVGVVTFLVALLPVDSRPSAAVLTFVAFVVVFGGAGVGQVVQCRTDLHTSWCDPRYEQEERILSTLRTDRRPESRGHPGGALNPGVASFVFEAPPDPLHDVTPVSAVGERIGDAEVRWDFGGADNACTAVSRVQPTGDGYELTITVDCR